MEILWLHPGKRVVIKRSLKPGQWDPEWMEGKHGEFIDYNIQGYARVRFDARKVIYLVRPESLQPEEGS